jgi:pimeloyl-ACP methyl ester carboxylesterase
MTSDHQSKATTRMFSGERLVLGTKVAGIWLLRAGLGFFGLTLILALSGLLYQEVASRSDRSEFPAPGGLVDLDGRQIHLQEAGTSRDGPTVVLLAGAGSMSTQWAWVQQDVADFARVISYDRAGLGWSEPSDQPQDAIAVADDLYRLLKTAEIPGPYILVGHSLGGAHARVFADRYQEEVAGMVLLDPVSPEFWTRVDPDALDEPRSAARQAKLFPHLARLGVFRIMNPFAAATEGLPKPDREAANAIFASTQHSATSRDDYQQILEKSETMGSLRSLEPAADVPLIVLSRTEPDDEFTGPQQEIDAELAATSVNGIHRLVHGADHITLVTKKEFAQETTDAVRDVLEIVVSQG